MTTGLLLPALMVIAIFTVGTIALILIHRSITERQMREIKNTYKRRKKLRQHAAALNFYEDQ